MSTFSLSYLARGLDRPAARAAQVAERGWAEILAPGVVGLGAIASSIALASLLGPSRRTPDALRPFLETLIVLVPAAAIGTTYFGLKLSIRRFAAAAGLGLMSGGVVAISVLPLLGFIALAAANVRLPWFWSPAVVVAGAALGTFGAVVGRVLDVLDASTRARVMSRGFIALAFALFGVRVAQLFG